MPANVNIISGYVAQSPSGGRVPPTRFDAVVGRLAEYGVCRSAMWGGRATAAGLPYDRITAQPYVAQGTQPPLIAADATFQFRGASAPGILLPSVNLNNAGGFNTGANSGRFTQSWTVAIVFAPAVTGNFGGLAYAFLGASTAAAIQAYSAGIKVTSPLNTGPFLVTPVTIYANAPNIIVINGDATTRQVAAYVNSLTPQISAVGGMGANPWPDLSNLGTWAFGTASSTFLNGKIYGAAAFDRSLYHQAAPIDENDPTPDYPGLMLNLIRAAAHDFAIPLV